MCVCVCGPLGVTPRSRRVPIFGILPSVGQFGFLIVYTSRCHVEYNSDSNRTGKFWKFVAEWKLSLSVSSLYLRRLIKSRTDSQKNFGRPCGFQKKTEFYDLFLQRSSNWELEQVVYHFLNHFLILYSNILTFGSISVNSIKSVAQASHRFRWNLYSRLLTTVWTIPPK
jgi:hypothetical protein